MAEIDEAIKVLENDAQGGEEETRHYEDDQQDRPTAERLDTSDLDSAIMIRLPGVIPYRCPRPIALDICLALIDVLMYSDRGEEDDDQEAREQVPGSE
ncbi:MAG: hypothetical protein ACYTEQ_03520 [Planctomycetota bacterium]|jgi:hypothetical protein